MIRVYIMPLIGAGGRVDPRRPKHADLAGVVAYGSVRYGEEGDTLCGFDLDQAAHDIIAADAEVLVLPLNLDNNLTAGAVTQAETFLESINMPGDWVNTTFTYREVLRLVGGAFLFQQRYASLSGQGQLFTGAMNLDRTVSSLTQQLRDDIQATADSFGYDSSPITGAWTLRQVVKHYGQQWADPIDLNVITI